jgi:hypothetical protein
MEEVTEKIPCEYEPFGHQRYIAQISLESVRRAS